MIPEAKQAAVQKALQAAFGVNEFESITPMTAGLSTALIFKIIVRGKPYLLRVIMRTDEMANPTQHFACMKIAEAGGLAPRVWYTSIEDRIAITDFITAQPFHISQARVMLPGILKQLHALPLFPPRINYLDVMDGVVRKFQASKRLPEHMLVNLFEQYDRIKAVYPNPKEEWVSCHNDFKPGNFLYDGNAVWMVDWEASFPNNRYMELCMAANFVVINDDDEKVFLQEYFGEPATKYQSACFFLMRQLMHVIYGSFLINITDPALPIDLNTPSFRELHDQLWEDRLSVGDTLIKHQYALVHLKQVQENFKLKRFEDSLKIVETPCPPKGGT